MKSNCLARTTDVGETLIDEKRPVIIVEGARPSHKMLHFFDPGRMVNQLFKGLAAFVDLLKIDAVIVAEIVSLHPALPFSPLNGQQRIQCRVELAHLVRCQRALEQNETVKIKEVALSFSYVHALPPNRFQLTGSRRLIILSRSYSICLPWREPLRPNTWFTRTKRAAEYRGCA